MLPVLTLDLGTEFYERFYLSFASSRTSLDVGNRDSLDRARHTPTMTVTSAVCTERFLTQDAMLYTLLDVFIPESKLHQSYMGDMTKLFRGYQPIIGAKVKNGLLTSVCK